MDSRKLVFLLHLLYQMKSLVVMHALQTPWWLLLKTHIMKYQALAFTFVF